MLNIFKIPSTDALVSNIKNQFVRPLAGEFGKKKIDIETYKAKFLGGNARQYLFVCRVQFPGMQNVIKSGLRSGMSALSMPDLTSVSSAIKAGLNTAASTAITTGTLDLNTEDFKYFVRSTTLPESAVEETSTYFCGKQYKLSSVRRTQDWQVQFLVNHDATVLQKFSEWNYLMENPETGAYGKPQDYMTDQSIQLIGLDGAAICTYKLYGAYPKSIGAVTLDYASNEFATFDVTFGYQYHTVAAGEGEPGLLTSMRKSGYMLSMNSLMGLGEKAAT